MVLLHLLVCNPNLVLNKVELRNYSFNLVLQLLRVVECFFEAILCVLSQLHLLGDGAVNLILKLLFHVSNLALVLLHGGLVGCLLNSVAVNRLLDLLPDLVVFINLFCTFIFLGVQIVSNQRHPLLKLFCQDAALASLVVKHGLMF